MILFLGDSFTWGQGLHYYYKIENNEWTWNDCKEFVNSRKRFESLGFEADEYRRQHSFPYLVSKELDEAMVTPRFENGGDNYAIFDTLENLHLFCSNTNITNAIIQFSAPTRMIEKDDKSETIEAAIKSQIYKINFKCNQLGIKWYGISWYKEMGEILKESYSENYIPVLYEDKEYESFDYQKHDKLKELTIQYTQNISDGHFNKEGHQVIANSILNKLK